MVLLEREIVVDEETLTIDELVDRQTGHLHWPVRDIVRSDRPHPDEASLARAATRVANTTPTGLVQLAAWLELRQTLMTAGLDAGKVLGVAVEVLRSSRPGGAIPRPATLVALLEGVDAEVLRALVTELSDEPLRNEPAYTLVASAPLVEEGEPPPGALEAVWLFRVPIPTLRAHLLAATPERREAVLLKAMTTEEPNVAHGVSGTLEHLADLLDTPVLENALTELFAVAADHPSSKGALDPKASVRDERGMTPQVRECFEYWQQFFEADRKRARLGPVAEAAARVRLPVVDAAELQSLEAWTGASDERREAIAEAVLDALGRKVFRRRGWAGDIALFAPKRRKLELALIPGGTFERGLSETEEQRLHELVRAAGLEDVYEEWGVLVDQIPAMRPVSTVHVAPFLIGRAPGRTVDAVDLVERLEEGPFRLPTEAEWEYAARGDRPSELTAFGNELPTEQWYRATKKAKEAAANRFGLWGFGFPAEVCTDAWVPSYVDAPTDGSAVDGPGPRAVRGGAAELFPWQGVGEWQLMLSAMRWKQNDDFRMAFRPTIGLRLD